jgi:hypothetical protein
MSKKIFGAALVALVLAVGLSLPLVAQESPTGKGTDGVAGVDSGRDGAPMHDGTQKCPQCAEYMNSYKACQEAFTHCTDKGGKHADGEHLRMLLDCAEICRITALLHGHRSELCAAESAVCMDACARCAASCERVASDDPKMKACAEQLRQCTKACQGATKKP